jgi:hypothetical protein
VAFSGLEPKERPCADLRHLGSGGHLDGAVDDQHPGVLVYLVLAQLLTRLEDDEDGARTSVLVHYHRITCSRRRVHLEQIPVLHSGSLFDPATHPDPTQVSEELRVEFVAPR